MIECHNITINYLKNLQDVDQEKAFLNLIDEEKLSKEKIQTLNENYLYSEQERLRDEILALLEGKKPTLLQRKPVGDRISKKIIEFIDIFINGMVGGQSSILG